MAFVFSGLRQQGGISGKQEDSLDSMGITWDEFSQRKSEMLEFLKDDVDEMLNDLCKGTNFSADSIGIPRRRKPSILAIPTVKTPGIVRRRPSHRRAATAFIQSPTVFKSSPATRSKRTRINSPPHPSNTKTCTIVTPPQSHIDKSPVIVIPSPSPTRNTPSPAHNTPNPVYNNLSPVNETTSPTHNIPSPTHNTPSSTHNSPVCVESPKRLESPPTKAIMNEDLPCVESPGSEEYESPSAPSPDHTSTQVLSTSPQPYHTPVTDTPSSPVFTTISPPNPSTPNYATPLKDSPSCSKPSPESPCISLTTNSMNETFVISSTTCESQSEIDLNVSEQRISNDSNKVTACSVSVHDIVRGNNDQCVDQDRTTAVVSSNDEPSTKMNKDGMFKKWNELMNSAIKEHHQQRLKNDIGIVGGVKHGLAGPVGRNSPVKAVESQQLRSQRLAEKIAEKAEREAARQKELQLKKEQERSERARKREERMKRIADNQAAIQEKEKRKLMKLQEGKNVVKEKPRKENLKLKERQLAAEQRRQEQERLKKLKLKEIEEERRLVEELHAKRMKLEEEERQRKKVEKAEIEKERMKRKDEDHKKPAVAMATTTAATLKQKQQSPDKNKRKKYSPIRKPILAAPPPSKATANKPVLSSKYQDVSTYNITPMNPLLEADNYNIDDLASDESSDDEDAPKKAVPMWAAPMNLIQTIKQQEIGESTEQVDNIFPPEELLQSPNLARIFPQLRKRFFKRTSSAQWSSPILKKK